MASQLKTNSIHCGDALEVLKKIPDKSIDLIYIDPPFNSSRNYEVFWGDIQEKRAFEDRFGDAEAYIKYMRPRIVELYRVLKDTGSFYYHCDWHASHYIKIMLDQIFNFNNFQNEIIWCYGGGGASKKRFARKHDTIFFYSKSNKYNFVPQFLPYKPHSPYHSKGEPYRKEGKVMEDYWLIEGLGSTSKERRGYPTQKPIRLLERILETSSKKDDIVLDAFCGCGTTLVVAEKLKRKWIGIDISPTACREMSQRLWDLFKLEENKDFMLVDLPKTEEDLMALPHFEFENWAVIALGGIPNRVKVGDYGIDGKLYPAEREKIKSEEKGLFGDIDIYYPIQAKQIDKVGRPDIDKFETAIRRDKRNRGYFVAFGFTKGSIEEIKRLDKEEDIEIRPIRVSEILRQQKIKKK